jgi:hypothetical protein
MSNRHEDYMPFQHAQEFADEARSFISSQHEPSGDECARIQAFAQVSIAYSLIEISHRLSDMTNQICLAIVDPKG